MVLVDYFPALPTGEEQHQHEDGREPRARTACGSRAADEVQIEIYQLQHDGRDIAAGMPPRIVQIANLDITEHVDEPDRRRLIRRYKRATPEPKFHLVTGPHAGSVARDVGKEGGDKSCNPERDEHIG